MDIKPHPEKPRRALITVDTRAEAESVVHIAGLSLFRSLSLTMEYLIPEVNFPRDIDISRRQLGHIAGNALTIPYNGPTPENLNVARQILDFFEQEQQAIVPDPAH